MAKRSAIGATGTDRFGSPENRTKTDRYRNTSPRWRIGGGWGREGGKKEILAPPARNRRARLRNDDRYGPGATDRRN